jgi:hypothetical protein
MKKVENYPPLEMALKLHGAWRAGAVIYFAARNSDNSLVRYFNPSAIWIETDKEKMESDLQTLQGRVDNAWLETSLS